MVRNPGDCAAVCAPGNVVHLEYILEQYYRARGWNAKIAIPIREKLLELDLVDMADDVDPLLT